MSELHTSTPQATSSLAHDRPCDPANQANTNAYQNIQAQLQCGAQLQQLDPGDQHSSARNAEG